MWLKQNVRRKGMKDELGEVAKYLYHIRKGCLGYSEDLLTQYVTGKRECREAHWRLSVEMGTI